MPGLLQLEEQVGFEPGIPVPKPSVLKHYAMFHSLSLFGVGLRAGALLAQSPLSLTLGHQVPPMRHCGSREKGLKVLL